MNKQQNVLDLLYQREKYGVRQNQNVHFSGISDHRSSVHRRDLAIVSNWNSKRLQNMILAIGPGTPASLLARPFGDESLSGTDMDEYDDDNDDAGSDSSHGGDSDSDSDSISANQPVRVDREDKKKQTDGNETNEGDDGNISSSLSGRKRWLSGNRLDEECNQDESDPESSQSGGHSSSPSMGSQGNFSFMQQSPNRSHMMKHGGCINTAAWMDCPWRISSTKTDDSSILDEHLVSSSYPSNSSAREEENDRIEISKRAISSDECPTQIITSGDDRIIKFWDVSLSMGVLSPQPCWTTHCPFLNKNRVHPSPLKRWKRDFHGTRISGGVDLLASLRTGHRGNVFHATPLFDRPGDVLTCAADGLLNLCNIETEEISTILSIEESLPPMCFSHHMLDENTGLLCSESGLYRFDIRVPRSSQSSEPLLGHDLCKSCAVYSATEAESSAYVFVGGASTEVGLYDLRFLGNASKVVQTYRPTCFPSSVDVAVSGIDLSKDKKELLVSYENDQIYTFPVFSDMAADPSVDEMLTFSKRQENPEPNEAGNDHFAGYGGHLNRFTFLKCAKYAGLNDEYICTGSDSGHAFIYDKFSGAVVSLLKADESTCNGIIPHPTLPIFVTYGIASTAKLWRATVPVSDEDDDSVSGRRKAYEEQPYVKSDVVSKWTELRSNLAKMSSNNNLATNNASIFPNELPLRSVTLNGHAFEGLPEAFFRSLFHSNPFNPGSDIICNDLSNLPEIVRYNFHEAVLGTIEDEEIPVRCGINELSRRISMIRLCHQAQQCGLKLARYDKPWQLELIKRSDDDIIHPTAIIPDNPGDWLPFAKFGNSPRRGGRLFNKEKYHNFYYSRYHPKVKNNDNDFIKMDATINEDEEIFDSFKAWDVLYDTIKELKEEGNMALKRGSFHLAARNYDKAIVYGAVAFMEYPHSNLDFVISHQKLLSKNAGHCVRWSELLKTFISTRLNLSMVMLKAEIADPNAAYKQAMLALKDLLPFCAKPSEVLTGKKLHTIRGNEPIETYREAKELQVKAYFRLGSAKLQSGDYNVAIQNFEKCLTARKVIHPGAVPDKAVVHRLAEAKRLCERRRKKRRKQFKSALLHDNGKNEDNSQNV